MTLTIPFLRLKTSTKKANNKKNTFENHPYYIQLMNELSATKSAIDLAYSNFENVTDQDLIDCSIYEMNAMQKRYQFLLTRVKQLEKLPE